MSRPPSLDLGKYVPSVYILTWALSENSNKIEVKMFWRKIFLSKICLKIYSLFFHKVVGLPNKVRRDAQEVPSHGTESETSLKVKKKFYLSIQMWFLAFDSQEICCTHGEKENIDKYNTGAMKIHLNVKRDTKFASKYLGIILRTQNLFLPPFLHIC